MSEDNPDYNTAHSIEDESVEISVQDMDGRKQILYISQEDYNRIYSTVESEYVYCPDLERYKEIENMILDLPYNLIGVMPIEIVIRDTKKEIDCVFVRADLLKKVGIIKE